MDAKWMVLIFAVVLKTNSGAPAVNMGCSVCRLVVADLKEKISNPEKQADVQNLVQELCGHFTTQISECEENLGADMVGMLEKLIMDLNPDEFCSRIEICFDGSDEVASSGFNFDEVARQNIQEVVSERQKRSVAITPACEMCKFLVELVDNVIHENRSLSLINSTVYRACGLLPPGFQPLCSQYAPEIVAQMEKVADPENACVAIRLCAPSSDSRRRHSNVSAVVPMREESPLCTVCEFLVKTLDYLLKGNKSEAAVNNTVYKLCDLLSGNEKALCEMMAPLLVKELQHGFDPKKACTAIRACTNSTQSVDLQLKVDHLNLPTRGAESAATLPCEICEAVVELAEELLNQTSKAEVNSTVYGICMLLPSDLKKMCLEMAPKIVTALEDPTIAPHEVCSVLGLCTTEKFRTPLPTQQQIAGVERSPSERASLLCEICEVVVELLDEKLKENRTDQFVNKTIYEICDSLPASFQDMCYELAPKLYQRIIAGSDPESACSAINVCSSASQPREDFAEFSMNDIPSAEIVTKDENPYEDLADQVDARCELCNFGLKSIMRIAQGLSPEALTRLCSSLPASVQLMCNGLGSSTSGSLMRTFACMQYCPASDSADTVSEIHVEVDQDSEDEAVMVDENAFEDDPIANHLEKRSLEDNYIEFLTDVMGESENDVHYVQKEMLALNAEDKLKAQVDIEGEMADVACELCKEFVKLLVFEINQNENILKEYIKDICNRLPGPTSDKCDDFVDSKLPSLIQEIIEKFLKPEAVCALLQLCPKEQMIIE